MILHAIMDLKNLIKSYSCCPRLFFALLFPFVLG
jgi:hypothetical protein